jgi:hypothetical protein
MPRPLCLIVMPFGTKPVVPRIEGQPARVDFDRLWHAAVEPALQDLGYEVHRADQDTGALIINEMLERLYFSDLVVADMTLPNGNVYYEVGIRHAARSVGCALIAAAWARPLFDTQQMRRVTYPLGKERIDDDDAATIRSVLVDGVRDLAQGTSPMNIVLPGYPSPDPARATAMRLALAETRDFQERVDAVRLERSGDPRKRAARTLADALPAGSVLTVSVAISIVSMLRDADLWDETRDYIAALPAGFRDHPWMRQQHALAMSKAKSSDHLRAIAALQGLIKNGVATSESYGLIGGRYKRLFEEALKANDPAAARSNLNNAIKSYEQGTQADLSGYFSVSNLARLYRARNGPGDARKAEFALQLTIEACRALKARRQDDEWLNATLLGAAFDLGDLEMASRLTEEVEAQGAAAWQLATTIDSLRLSVSQVADDERCAGFEQLIRRLEQLLQTPSA